MDKKEALKKIALIQIKVGDFFLGNADYELKADKEVVLAAVKKMQMIFNTPIRN